MNKNNFVSFDAQPAHLTIGRNEREGFIERTVLPWTLRWCYNENTRILIVPAGYVWDGASIPRIGWTVIGLTPGGLADGPSLAHDIPYRAEGGRLVHALAGCTIKTIHGVDVVIDRDEADWLLKACLISAGVKPLRANVVYRIVRHFGDTYWGGPAPKFKR